MNKEVDADFFFLIPFTLASHQASFNFMFICYMGKKKVDAEFFFLKKKTESCTITNLLESYNKKFLRINLYQGFV